MGALSSQIQALITYANETTGKEDTRMGDAVQSLIDGYGGGGSTEVDENADVLFIDYDGTPIARYTIAEAKALTALPTPPTHDGLVFEEWNWTLEEIQAMQSYQKAIVGATYDTEDGGARFRLHIIDGHPLSFALSINGTSGTIDWGDNTTSDITKSQTYSHDYSSLGDYVVKVSGDSIPFYGPNNVYGTFAIAGYGLNVEELNIGSHCSAINVYASFQHTFAKRISLSRGFQPSSTARYWTSGSPRLTSLVIPRNILWGANNGVDMTSMKFLSFPSKVSSGSEFGSGSFSGSYALARFIIPEGVTTLTAINNTAGMKNVDYAYIPSSVTTFTGRALWNYSYGGVVIIGNTDAVITASSTDPFSGTKLSTFKIYVPDALVDSYKAADYWSTYASYIYPLSEYQG